MIKYDDKSKTIRFTALDKYDAPVPTFVQHYLDEYDKGIELIKNDIGPDLEKIALAAKDKISNNKMADIDIKIIPNFTRVEKGYKKTIYQKRYHHTCIYVKFGMDVPKSQEELNKGIGSPARAILIPEMDEKKGVIKRLGTEYAFKNELSKGPGLSWVNKDNSLECTMNTNTFQGIKLDFKKSQVVVKYSGDGISKTENKSKSSVFALLIGLALEQGIPYDTAVKSILSIRSDVMLKNLKITDDPLDYFNERVLAESFPGFSKLEDDLGEYVNAHVPYVNYRINRKNIDDIVEALEKRAKLKGERIEDIDIDNVKADTALIHDPGWESKDLQQDYVITTDERMLLGRILSRDVKLNGKVIAKRGDRISQRLLTELENKNCIIFYDSHHINNTLFLYGNDDILELPKVPANIAIPDALYEYIAPAEHFGHFDQVSDKDRESIPLIIANKSAILLTEDIVQFLVDCGVHSIKAKNTPTSQAYQILPLESEWVFFDKSVPRITFWSLLHQLSVGFKMMAGKDIPFINMDRCLTKILKPISNTMYECYKYALNDSRNAITSYFSRRFQEIAKSEINVSDLFNGELLSNFLWASLSQNFWNRLSEHLELLGEDNAINPVSYYSAMTKVTIPGISGHSASADVRQMSLMYYGRLDAFEAPQSSKIGLVNNLCMYTKIDEKGNMLAPLRRVKNGIISDEVEYLTVREECQTVVADIVSMHDENGRVKTSGLVLAKIPYVWNGNCVTVEEVDASLVEYVTAYPTASLSLSSSMLPFITNNDPVRVTFGQQQVKQGKSILNPQPPIVKTDSWDYISKLTDEYCEYAPFDGAICQNLLNVERVTNSDERGSESYIGTQRIVNMYKAGPENAGAEVMYEPIEKNGNSMTRRFAAYAPGYKVKKDESLIMRSNWINDKGTLQIGRNVLIAYLSDGYNYDDGITVSSKFANEFSSMALQSEKLQLKENRRIREPGKAGMYLYRYLQPGDKIATIKTCDSNKITNQNAVRSFDKDSVIEEHEVDWYSKRMYGFTLGTVIDKNYKIQDKPDEAITMGTLTYGIVERNDKFTNRHGNKTTVSRILPPESVPRLDNGESLDLLYNYSSVGSRMNIGQIIECCAGLAGYVLKVSVCSNSYGGATQEDIMGLLKVAHDLANSGDRFEAVANSLAPTYGTDFVNHVKQHKDWIQYWEGCFDEEGCTKVKSYDGMFETETKVQIGVSYIIKMIQETHTGLGYRGGFEQEKYNSINEAPPRGSHAGGGQRIGTMEFDALLADGVDNLIDELLNERGDNVVARNNMMCDFVVKKRAIKSPKVSKSYAMRRSTLRLINYLDVLGISFDLPKGLKYPSKEDARKRAVYDPRFFREALFMDVNEYVEDENEGYYELSILDKFLQDPNTEYGEIIQEALSSTQKKMVEDTQAMKRHIDVVESAFANKEYEDDLLDTIEVQTEDGASLTLDKETLDVVPEKIEHKTEHTSGSLFGAIEDNE